MLIDAQMEPGCGVGEIGGEDAQGTSSTVVIVDMVGIGGGCGGRGKGSSRAIGGGLVYYRTPWTRRLS